jgi:hypothetical protein
MKNSNKLSTLRDLDRALRRTYCRAIAYAPLTDIVPERQRREFDRALRDIARLRARVQVRAGIAAPKHARSARVPKSRRCAHCGRGHRRRPRSRVTASDLPPWVPIWDRICFSRLTRAARREFLRLVEREEDRRAEVLS